MDLIFACSLYSGVDIVPGRSNCCLQNFGGSNCCLNFALWFSIAMNREIHKASAVMDILYIFIWLPDIKTQNYCCRTNNFHYFICGGSNWCLNFTWRVQLLPALRCRGAVPGVAELPQCSTNDTFLPVFWKLSYPNIFLNRKFYESKL